MTGRNLPAPAAGSPQTRCNMPTAPDVAAYQFGMRLSPLDWSLLQILDQAKDSYASYKAIAEAWTEINKPSPKPRTRNAAINSLKKKKLKPLGITVECKRGQGWKLASIEAAPTT